MSAHLKGRPAASYVIDPAVHKWKKASRAKKREIHGGNRCDSQHGCQASTCDVQNIKISGVFSLCQSSNHYNSSVTSLFNVGQHGPTVGTPADVNDYKILSEIDVEYVCLDTDAASTSSNELDCNIGKEGESMSENISSAKCNHRGKNSKKILSSDLTEGTLYKTPKLSFYPKVPTVMAELENSRICDETSAKEDFMKNTENSDSVQLHIAETILSPCNKTEKVLDVAQTLSHLKSLQNDTGKNVIQSKLKNLRKNKSSSIVYPKESGIETLAKISEVQRKSSSSVNPRTVALNNQPEPDTENNIGNKLSNKMYCCALCWSASVYGKKLEGSCKYSVDSTKPELGNIARSPPASQIALELKSCRDDVFLVKELKNSSDTAQTRSTAVPQLKMQGQPKLHHRKRQESNDNSGEYIQDTQKPKTYILEKRSGVGRRNSKGENEPSERKQKSILVSELKTVRLCNKSKANNPKKAQPSDIQLNTAKEVKSISSKESDSNIMEVEVSVPENVRKGLPRECISQQVSVSSAMMKQKNRKVGETDPKVSMLNTNHLKLNSETTGAIQSDRTKVLDVAQGRLALAGLMNVSEKIPVQSEQNKCVRNEGGNSYVHREQKDKLARGSVVYSYQDNGPEPPKNNRQKATGAIPPDNPSNVLDVAQDHWSLTSRKNDCEKKSVQSKKNKLARNKGTSSFVHPKQTDTQFCYSAHICGEQSECSHINKPTENTTRCTPAGRPECTYETIETLASPTLDVIEFNICNKKRRGRKSCSNDEDTSQLHLKKKEQSLLTQLDKNLNIKKDKMHTYLSPKNSFTSTTRDPCLDLHLKTESAGCFRDGGFSLKSDNVGSPLSEQDFKVHMSKETQPKHPKNIRHLPNDLTRPKKRQRSEVPEARSTGLCPAKSDSSLIVQMSKEVQPKPPKNKRHLPIDMTRPKKQKRLEVPEAKSTGVCLAKYSSHKLEVSEQTISSKKALILFISSMADKSEREISPGDHLKSDIQKVKSNQNSKRSTKMSCTTFHSKTLFPDQQTNTASQLRMLDTEQELTKSNNKAIENKTSVVKQNSTDFTFVPAVQKVTEETHQEKKRRGKQTQSKNLCISVDGMKTSSAVRRKKEEKKERRLHIPLYKKKATVDSSLSVWKNSTHRMGIEQHTKSMNVLHKVAPSTSDAEVKTLDASCCGVLIKQPTLKDNTCIKQCVLQLCRLAVPLERPFLLGNVRETCKHYKVQGKADAEKQAK